MSTGTVKEFSVSRGYAYYVFSLLFILYMFDFTDRYVIASLYPYIKADWGLSDTQCGLLMSTVTWAVLVLTFPISILIDRWSRKKSIGIMATIWSLACGACAFTTNFGQLFVARTILGAGEAGYTSGGYAMISAYFPEEKRSTMNGLWNTAYPLGAALGIIIGGIIAVKLGWRYAFGLVALPGLIIAILFFWVKDYKTVDLVKEEKRERASTPEKMKIADIIISFVKTPSLMMTYFGYAGNIFFTVGLITWLPTYYSRMEGLAMDKAGMKASVIMLLAVIGAPLGGIITDWWRKKRLNARMSIPALSSLLTAGLMFIGFLFFEGTAQYLILLLVGLVTPMFVPGGSAVTQDVVHPGLRAISYSIAVITQSLLGASLAPIFIGAISDSYDLLTAFKLLPLFALLSFVLFFIGSFYYERDLAKVEKVILEEEST